LSENATPIHPTTGRRSLLPSSSTRRPIGDHLAAGLPRREDDGLTTFHGCITDGLGSACPPVTRQRRQGKEEAPALGHVPFWFKPVSAFGLLDLTTFISSSPELAMPSTLAPDRIGVGSRRTPSRDIRPLEGEDTLSQELRTVGLLRPHVLVGYRWSHTGLHPGCKSSYNRYIRSFVSQPPQIRACTSRAPGSSSHEFVTRAIRRRYVDMVQVTRYLPGFASTAS